MPRAKRIVKDKYKVFSERLCQLIEEKGITQNQLAETIGKTRQTINGYTLGNTAPDSDTLIELSNYFNVSVDYLLGLSNVKTLDVQVKSICEYTGLTEMAVLQLNAYKYATNEVYKVSSSILQSLSDNTHLDVKEIEAILNSNAELVRKEKEEFIALLSKLIINCDFLNAISYCNSYIYERKKIKQRNSKLEQLQILPSYKLKCEEDDNGVNLYYAQKYLNRAIDKIADDCIDKGGD